ncbi:MAG: DinB family protein [Anaerolineae bacterium]|nr:DinB family protein [Anaerolineae bacterium]MCO5192076.1 DinB family protein [Anaerolineae bacterium]MCO5207731.1 DinB family protein [Anaerolineae bacterium]
MFAKQQAQTVFAYHWHNTQQLLTFADQLSSADYHAHPGYGHGSIHDLFLHVLRTDASWRIALETGQQHSPIDPVDFPSLAEIKRGFAQEQTAWDTHFADVTSSNIEGRVMLTNWRGDRFEFPQWGILQHLVLHGMQHHTEIAQLLTSYGQSPGDIDLVFFLMQSGGQ